MFFLINYRYLLPTTLTLIYAFFLLLFHQNCFAVTPGKHQPLINRYITWLCTDLFLKNCFSLWTSSPCVPVTDSHGPHCHPLLKSLPSPSSFLGFESQIASRLSDKIKSHQPKITQHPFSSMFHHFYFLSAGHYSSANNLCYLSCLFSHQLALAFGLIFFSTEAHRRVCIKVSLLDSTVL